MKISAVVFSKDSEKTIDACLRSVNWVDELVVIDMGSNNETFNIYSKYTKNVQVIKNLLFVEPIRNEGVEKATGDWILVLDADEELTPELSNKLKGVVDQEADVWEIPRKNIIWGEWMNSAGWWPDYQKRFFRKGTLKWKNKIHSVPEHKGKLSKIDDLEKYAIIHHNYASVDEYVERLNKYTRIEAGQSTEKQITGLEANEAFMSDYFRRLFKERGYESGDMGIILAVMQAFYQFLVKVKIWEIRKNNGYISKKEFSKMIRRFRSQMSYWAADYEIYNQNNMLQKYYWRIRRKLRI